MKKKQGFTLVEVLAIIVVLSIVSTITVPIVLNTIENARKSAASLSALGYVNALEKKVAMSSMLDGNTYEDKEYAFDEIDVDVNGVKPTAGIYELSNYVITNATFCINGYTVTYQDGRASTGSKCNVESMKLNGSIRVTRNSALLVYPSEDSIQIIENKSNGEVTCSSSNTDVATCEIDGNNVLIRSGVVEGRTTITVTSHGGSGYNDASAAILVSTEPGLLSVTANDYDDTYDGQAHGISVSSSGAMIKYGTSYGTYDLDNSPTYTDVGVYTVYYQVTKAGYNTVTGSKTVTITKASGSVVLDTSSGTMNYGEEKEINIVSSTGELSVSGFDSSIVSAEIINGKLVLNGLKVGSTTITVTSGSNNNYDEASTTYEVSVVKSNNILVLSSSSGTVVYPNNISFEVTQNPSGGALSCSSSNNSAATCSVSGNTITVTAGTEASNYVAITVTSASTSNYNAGQAVYVVTSENSSLLSVTADGYSGVYDGESHGITVTSSGSTIKYGTVEGTYDLDSNPTYTNVGSYTVYYQVSKPGYVTVTGNRTVVITRANGSITAPTAKVLTYNDNPQELINAGSSSTGTIEYKLGDGNYSTSIPTATLDGTYTVYYRVIGDGNHNDVAESSISVTINKATINYTAGGYNNTFDGNSHGITVEASGATIKYGTSLGTYNLDASPTYSDVGTYTVYYQITRTGYTTVNESKTVVITKANGSIVLSENSGSVTYPGNTTFTVTENISGGELSCSSSNNSAATCSVSGNTITVTAGTEASNYVVITVTSASTNNYNETQEAYVLVSQNGLLSYTANGYDGYYDGEAHGITVTSSGATIKYGTVDGTYDLNSSPTYTSAGTYTVYYQITKAGYKTVTGNQNVIIRGLSAGDVDYGKNGKATVEDALDDLFTKFPQ